MWTKEKRKGERKMEKCEGVMQGKRIERRRECSGKNKEKESGKGLRGDSEGTSPSYEKREP